MSWSRRYHPGREAAREYAKKMNEIQEFCDKNCISYSSSMDSYYFEVNNKKYRVSNHTVEASNRNAYDDLGNQIRDKYHDGRRKDTIYIHAGKTRIMDIYNDLANGYELDGRGYRR